MSGAVECTSRSACKRVADTWDAVIEDFLKGKSTNACSPLDRWFEAYNGGSRGAVDLSCFPEPYLGDILGEPRAAILALNPGGAVPSFQARDGIFAREIRKMGCYREWAKSWPYLRDPWGRNSHHISRMQFLKRWFRDDALPPSARIDFELYPWHSTRVTSRISPETAIIDEFIWEPLKELGVKFVFAFGRPWLDLLDRLPRIEVVRRIGEGGKPYATTRKLESRTAVVKARTDWGGWLIIEKHSGSAGPPGPVEIEAIRSALGFD